MRCYLELVTLVGKQSRQHTPHGIDADQITTVHLISFDRL